MNPVARAPGHTPTRAPRRTLARPLTLSLALTACGARCASTASATRADPLIATGGAAELAPALPTAEPSPPELASSGRTGAPIALRFGTHREQASAHYLEFLRRLAARDVEGTLALFDANIADMNPGVRPSISTSQLRAWLERLFLQADMTLLERAIPALTPSATSPAEARRRSISLGDAEGWVVDAPSDLGAARALAVLIPTRVMVRFVEGQPRIVGARLTMPR